MYRGTIYQMSMRTMTPQGTINAAAELLPYVADLGFEYVYIMPVWEMDGDLDRRTWCETMKSVNSPKNPYKIIDFYNVDPEHGTNEDLKSFVNTAHDCGLKVMFDLVYLHCGRNSRYAKENPDFLERDENGNVPYGETWPFARINFDNKAAREHLYNNMTMFVEEYKVDGFRCDCGDFLPVDFWDEAISRVKKIKPDIFMLNEGYNRETVNHGFEMIYTDNTDILYHNNLKLAKSEITVPEWKERFLDVFVKEGKFIRAVETHDIASVAKFNRLESELKNGRMECYIVLNYLLNGVPFVWNGNEFCDDSFNLVPGNNVYGFNSLKWSNAQTSKGKKRSNLIKTLNKLRKDFPNLQTAEVEILESDENTILVKRNVGNAVISAGFNFGENEWTASFDGDVILSSDAEIKENNISVKANGYFVCKNA